MNAFKGIYKGAKVTLAVNGDDISNFNRSLKSFKDVTGIEIQYSSARILETNPDQLLTAGNGTNLPDLADFSQPGLMANLARSGKIIDANKMINPNWLKQNYNQGYLDTATVASPGGKILGGIFHRVNTKGLVWYPRKAFEAAGYKVPQSFEELKTLMDQIVKAGGAPWCIGIGSSAGPGWPATDWVENILLRTQPVEIYDKWASGQLPFTSPEVRKAVQLMSEIWFNDKYVYGGRKQIVNSQFGDAPALMLQNPPKCWLYLQGNFITSFFDRVRPGIKGGVDYDFFPFPLIDPGYGQPLEFGGNLMSALVDRPEVRAVLQYFSTFEGVKGWVAAGGALSPHKDSLLSVYPTDTTRRVAETLLAAKVVRFDGSDLMPEAVGAGSFWQAMTDYVSGTLNLDQALEEAQQGWSNIKK